MDGGFTRAPIHKNQEAHRKDAPGKAWDTLGRFPFRITARGHDLGKCWCARRNRSERFFFFFLTTRTAPYHTKRHTTWGVLRIRAKFVMFIAAKQRERKRPTDWSVPT